MFFNKNNTHLKSYYIFLVPGKLYQVVIYQQNKCPPQNNPTDHLIKHEITPSKEYAISSVTKMVNVAFKKNMPWPLSFPNPNQEAGDVMALTQKNYKIVVVWVSKSPSSSPPSSKETLQNNLYFDVKTLKRARVPSLCL